MKKLVLLSILLSGFFALQAQYYGSRESALFLGANAEYKKPFGDFGDITKHSLGLNLSGKYLINRVIGIGFTAGYHNFKTKVGSTASTSQDLKIFQVPALLEATFYIPTWNRTLLPYAGLHFGGYLTCFSIHQQGNYPDPNISEKINKFAIGVGPHLGLMAELSEFFMLDIKFIRQNPERVKENIKFRSQIHMGTSHTERNLKKFCIRKITLFPLEDTSSHSTNYSTLALIRNQLFELVI